MDIPDALRRASAFSHFEDRQITALAQAVSRSNYPSGATVVRQGDSTRDAYLLESGEVQILRETRYGDCKLATLGTGDLFGEASFIDQRSRSSNVVTLQDTDLMMLNPLAVSVLTKRDKRLHIALLWAFWRSLAEKLRQANNRLAGFFSETGPRSLRVEETAVPETGAFYVGVDAKRQLFQEHKLETMEINFLASLSKEKKLAPGDLIFREGDPGDRMYVVLDGKVRISKDVPGAGEEALAFLERGDFFGEMALIDGQPRSADARAHTEGAVILAIPREVLEGILDIQKVSSLRLLEIFCGLVAQRLREIDDKLTGWFTLSGGELTELQP